MIHSHKMSPFVPLDLTTFDLVSPGIKNNCAMADNGKYYYIEIFFKKVKNDKNTNKILTL